jgi:hypothetical protein
MVQAILGGRRALVCVARYRGHCHDHDHHHRQHTDQSLHIHPPLRNAGGFPEVLLESNRRTMPWFNVEISENAFQHHSWYVQNRKKVSTFPCCGIIAVHLEVSP